MRTTTVALTLAMTLLAGCTSLQTAEMPSGELHTQIRAGELISIGDRILVVTADGSEHQFKVTELDDTSIHGKDEIIRIDDIVALQTRELSAGKTALLAGGASIGVVAALIVAALFAAGGALVL